MAKKWNVPEPFDPKNPSITFNTEDPLTQSVTNQSDKDSTDLNKIFERYDKTGLIPDALTGLGRQPVYGDFTVNNNFHEMQNTIARVNRAFCVLPAKVRDQFANDPGKLIDFLADNKNDEEAVRLGLKTRENAFVELADDGKTKITGAQRDALNVEKQNKELAAKAAKNPASGTSDAGAPAGAGTV